MLHQFRQDLLSVRIDAIPLASNGRSNRTCSSVSARSCPIRHFRCRPTSDGLFAEYCEPTARPCINCCLDRSLRCDLTRIYLHDLLMTWTVLCENNNLINETRIKTSKAGPLTKVPAARRPSYRSNSVGTLTSQQPTRKDELRSLQVDGDRSVSQNQGG
jgi:hypothetical protein